MKIDSYSFGRIVINGQEYTSDVIIYSNRVDASWWRKEGHRLQPADLTDVVNARPEILIVGTGHAGVMSVPKETEAHIAAHGIEVKIERTSKAVELYNTLRGKTDRLVAALHITC